MRGRAARHHRYVRQSRAAMGAPATSALRLAGFVFFGLGAVGCGPLAEALEPEYEVGKTYFGTNDYIEFQPGELPIILSVPHGGSEAGTGIPDRTGTDIVTTPDHYTQELAGEMLAQFEALTGKKPHVVYCHLLRSKLDANREIVEAAQGNLHAEQAWEEYHGFIEAAEELVTQAHGRGFLLDVHGHGHAKQRIEWGYLLTAENLRLSDATLNEPAYVQRSPIRRLIEESGAKLADLIRGPQSLGGLLEAKGVPSVPSPSNLAPLPADPYFIGGFIVRLHGSRDGGPVDAAQIEAPRSFRDTQTARQALARDFVEQFVVFYGTHYHVEL